MSNEWINTLAIIVLFVETVVVNIQLIRLQSQMSDNQDDVIEKINRLKLEIEKLKRW